MNLLRILSLSHRQTTWLNQSGEGDFLPPPPPPVDDLGNITSSQGAFPPPPPLDDVSYNVQLGHLDENTTSKMPEVIRIKMQMLISFKTQQVNPGGKTIEERRSSLDAEIDSLTSILADLESSSPYKPRTQQLGNRFDVICLLLPM
ncbi:hypothetical protein TURU_086609 [Turdus rufiventris]|nr:hypothetical protein TURU_086609 [Turdus rufiventris]